MDLKLKPKKLKFSFLDTGMWGHAILFFHGDGKKYKAYCKKHFKEDMDIEGDIGLTSYIPGEPILVWVEDLKRVPTIAHELLHAVSFLLREKGVIHTSDTEEVYAYLLGDLLRQVLSRKKWLNAK